MTDSEQSSDSWGQTISEARQAELQHYLDKWAQQNDHGVRRGPFEGVDLSGADVFSLAAHTLAGKAGSLNKAMEELLPSPDGSMKMSRLSDLHLEGADLRNAKLQNANLGWVHLEHANLMWADLQGAGLSFAHLDHADLVYTNLKFAHLLSAHLNDAHFDSANLESANLGFADCEGASFYHACLVTTDLGEARLEGVNLEGAQLAGSNLIEARFSAGTKLKDATLSDKAHGNAFLADVRWGEANLSVIDWTTLGELGQELLVFTEHYPIPFHDTPEEHLGRLKAAVRTNRQLATALRSQGLNEEADRFAFRAQLFQRKVLLRQHKFGRALGSMILDLISGYGYKPIRSFITYILVILVFAGAYLLNAQFALPHLTWDEALVLSISSFHGRGFFTSGISLSDTLARLAAGEAIIGLLIEVTFIATFTQRFFGK